MKYKFGVRAVGLFFVLFSSLGLLFSVGGILFTWVAKPRIQEVALLNISTLEDILATTGEGLDVMNNAIENAKDDLGIIETALDDLNLTFGSINESLDLSGALIGDDLRLIAIDSQNALNSASTAAEVIDGVLTGLSRIRILGLDYAPEVPLHISLGQMAQSLVDVPNSLDLIEQNLGKTTEGIDLLNVEFTDLSENIRALDSDLEDAQKVLSDYNTTVGEIEGQIDKIQKKLPLYLTLFIALISGILFWLGLSQTSILLQGINYLKGPQQIINVAELRREIVDDIENEIKDE